MDSVKLLESSEAFSPVRDFLNAMLKDTMAAAKAECGSLFLLDRDKKMLVLKSFLNSQPIDIQQIRRQIGEGISGQVAQNRTPILVKDIDHDSRFAGNGFKHYLTKSFISVPLVCSDGLIGLINLADKTTGESFSEKDLQFVTLIAKYACATVDHLRRSERYAQLEKYASVGKLAAGVVHEVNNPLDGIIRYTNMLLAQIHDNSVTREYLLEIKKGLNRIANITKSLLEFSHVINADAAKFKHYVNIHDLIDDALDMLKHKISSQTTVTKRYTSGFPRLKDIGISHVLINMIKNAADAMPAGGTLEITTTLADHDINIAFKDTGTGIDNSIKEKIFDPFFTTKSIDRGTGLGLAICKEIINKYEGRIEVASIQGAGATFIIVIPKKYCEA